MNIWNGGKKSKPRCFDDSNQVSGFVKIIFSEKYKTLEALTEIFYTETLWSKICFYV
jgi:16S rRNA A1518/A1519 N6-dimethyltransferase RsmA/KsgA/DIM1 with predicted DNA glycosylase/AP lyase activity